MTTCILLPRRILCLSAGCLAWAMTAGALAEEKPADPAKTRAVKVKDITLTIPESWKQQTPSNKLRLAQFAVPAVKGDPTGVEVTVFSFGASSVQANISRWAGQFQREGRKVKVSKGKSPLGQYVIVDLSGTYNQPVGPPIRGKTKALPGSRMLAAILVVKKKGVYYLKMAGAAKTVANAAKQFRASFGGDAKKEEEFKPDE